MFLRIFLFLLFSGVASSNKGILPLKTETKKIEEKLVELTPFYQAEYAITLVNAQEDSDVAGVVGHLALDQRRTSDRYFVEQNSTFFITYSDGSQDRRTTHVSWYESTDGKEYGFFVRILCNNEEEVNIEGGAYINRDGQLEVRYTHPFPEVLLFKNTSNFPLFGLRKILTQLSKLCPHQILPSLPFFYGENREPFDVEVTAIGKKKEEVIENPSQLPGNIVWIMNLGCYTGHTAGALTADYVVSKTILDSGIILSMTLPYPEDGFTLKATLSKITLPENVAEAPGSPRIISLL